MSSTWSPIPLLEPGALAATAFIAAVPRAGAGPLRTQPRLPDPRTRPGWASCAGPASAPRYFPLTYVAATHLAVQAPLGYDLGSDPLRGAVPAPARDTGSPAATPVMRLPVGGTGINVYRPVYRDGAPTADRRPSAAPP